MPHRPSPSFCERTRHTAQCRARVVGLFVTVPLLGCGSEGTADINGDNNGYVYTPEPPRECILPNGQAPAPTPPPAATPLEDGADTSACGGGAAEADDFVVDPTQLRQNISGFGASSAWSSRMSAEDADLLWSTTSGAGLSLHRIRIDPNGSTSEVEIAKLAAARGVKVWAAPWTPAGMFKTGGTGNDATVGGTLTDAAGFAARLGRFVTYMREQGVELYAISAQNEPDANVDYESCSYTGPELAAFIGQHLGPALEGSGVHIIGPETQNWITFPRYSQAILGDPCARAYTGIIATHEYGGVPRPHPQITEAGKEFWQTEIFDRQNNPPDPGMGSGLRIAGLIHDALTIGEMSAWHYWWVYPNSDNNGALWDRSSGNPSKRLWVEGNYARFVRPGFRRVVTEGTPPAGVLVSAFMHPVEHTLVIVAINSGNEPLRVPVYFTSNVPCTLTPWVTSATQDLVPQAPIAVSVSRAVLDLPAASVTSYVGG
jgi:glucuronoarabinoxylan endo-1,4-beta-xylanase